MTITLLMLGKNASQFIDEGYSMYINRLKKYVKVKEIIIPNLKECKNLDAAQIKHKESLLILDKIHSGAFSVLLDERGKMYSSTELADFLQHKLNQGIKELIFIVGGAYGVDESIKQAADLSLSLSKMTFTHQFIRIMLSEQLYRAFSILHNEPYHNQ